MIQYYTYVTKDSDCCVYRSINDKKKYRFLKLDNGLKVFIIQDERKTSSNNDQCTEEQGIKRIRLDESARQDSSANDESLPNKTDDGKI